MRCRVLTQILLFQGKDSVLAVAQEQTASLLKIISAGIISRRLIDATPSADAASLPAGTMKAEIKKGDVVQAKNVLAEQTQMIQHERESCQNELVAAGATPHTHAPGHL